MPDEPQPKHVAHPARSPSHTPIRAVPPHRSVVGEPGSTGPFVISGLKSAMQPVCEIEVTSNFSFLAGASLPEELVREAARLGHAGIAMTDAETLGGAVRAHVAAKEVGLPLAHGARVWLELGPHAGPHPGEGRALEVLLYATDRASWGALSTLLTRGKRGYAAPASDEAPGGIPDAAAARRWSKSVCVLRFHDLVETLVAARGGATLLAVVVPPWLPDQAFLEAVDGLARLMPDRIAVAVRRIDDPGSVAESGRALVLARHLGVPPVAAGDVRMHDADRRPLLDVLACIGARTTLARAGTRIAANAERRLRDPAVLRRRYLDLPEALETAWRFTERASAFSLDALRYEYPSEVVPAGTTAMEHLRALALRGAAERYPRGVPEKVRRQLEHEFAIIGDLRYEHYFLTVHEIVAFARGRGILCQGRGAAANSAVCFALGVTAVDPDRIDVLFERFVSRERNEPPDIDIDFEHERREEVIQHIYAKYGRDRAALVAEIVSYRGRSAVRDVAKVLGFSKDTIDRLASEVDRWSGGGLGSRDDAADLVDAAAGEPGGSRGSAASSWPPPVSASAGERLRAAGLDPGAPMVRHLARLVGQVLGFPRHRSQHVGGFVITNGPLAECVPIENAAMPDRTVIEWDKDDIDALGMLKIDILSLGMLTAVRKAIDLVNGDRTALALGAAATLAPDAPPVRADRAAASASALAVGQEPLDPSLPLEPPELLEFHAIPAEDPSTYDMISRADTVGVFQIESRAQMSMLPRLKPRCFYDLVVEVAIVRPGPIQGDMVHPYLRRRSGEEPVEYPDEAIRRVLGKTLGVPLFQEQAMALAVVAAGFTPGEADELRRAIAAWKRHGNQIARFGEQLEGGMLARGYSRRFATQVFEQIKGFSGYGFPESHAASFALLVYASAWLKRHHPAAFTAALLNSQPMGFYAPSQLVRDAVEHGIAVRAIDVHCSRWDATLERGPDPATWISDAGISDAGIFDASISRASGGFRDELDAGIGIGIGPACTGDSAAPEVERRSASRRAAAAGWGGPGVYRLRVAGAPAAPAHPRVRIDGIRIESLGEVPVSVPVTRANGSGNDSDASGSGGARRWRFLADVFGTREPPPADASSAAASSAASSIDAAVRRLHGRGRSAATAADASIDRIRRPSQDGRTAAVGSASDGSLYFVRTQPAVRLGLRLVRGLDLEEGHRIVEAVARHGPFSRLSDLLEASGVRVAALRRLAAADAFRSMGLDRQQAAWQILALRDRGRALWSFGAVPERSAEAANAEVSPPSASIAAIDPREPSLPPIRELSGIARDLESAGVSLRGHPIACLRPKLQRLRVIPCGFLRDERRTPAGRIVSVAGMVLIRQRPSTAKGILFITIEDETGTANLIVRPKTYARLRPALRGSVVLRVRGKVERRDGVAHVIVATAEDMTTAVES